MKEIRINRLTLENFKCHAHLELAPEGRSLCIYGDNATGKTSIYDAYLWLLFGKDSMGNGEKSIHIKPLSVSGDVKDHQAITSVEAEFTVDGEVLTFRRTYREVWATRRGSPKPVCQGNSSDYFVDGVPVRKNAFDAAVAEMVSEETFRMLTSVSHFAAGISWQERRAVLFDMTGTMTDREIMAQREDFSPLLDGLGKLSLADYKQKLLHQKKNLTCLRDDTPARINECQRVLQDIGKIDFAAARAEEQALTARLQQLQTQLMALEQDTILEKKHLALGEAKLRRDQLESRNQAHRQQQRSAGRDVAYLHNEISRETARVESSRSFLLGLQSTLQRYDREIQKCQDTYVQVNGEAFAGGICPTCGQALPFQQLQEATRSFNLKKEERLAELLRKAENLKAERQEAEGQVQEIHQEICQAEAVIRELEQQLGNAEKAAAAITDLTEYAADMQKANAEIHALEEQISQLYADSSKVTRQLRSELASVNDQLRFTQSKLAKEAIQTQTQQRIQALKADARSAAEALEDIETMLFRMEEFTRFKAGFLETSINGHFRLATFRLFRQHLSGGLEERCDVVYKGVPFLGLNNGMKVNVGIDIINALSRHYGVSVPLFVDNAEAVTRLEESNAQVIRLIVSEGDPQLRLQ